MSWHRSFTAFLALVTPPCAGQQAGGTADGPPRIAAQAGPARSASIESDDLHLRVISDARGRLHRAEVDVLLEVNNAVLLLSNTERTTTAGGEHAPILVGHVALPMRRVNGMTFAVDFDEAVPTAATHLFAQAFAISVRGQLLVTDIAGLGVFGRHNSGTAVTYDGPPISGGLAAITRVPPFPHTFGLGLSVTVPTNDWDLTQHVTWQHPGGSDVFLIMKKPAPGEGQLVGVRTHSIWIDLGQQAPAAWRVHIAVTQSWDPEASTLEFLHVQVN